MAVEKALANTGIPPAAGAPDLKTIRLEYVEFETGVNALTADSKYQLNDLAEILKKYPNLRIEVSKNVPRCTRHRRECNDRSRVWIYQTC